MSLFNKFDLKPIAVDIPTSLQKNEVVKEGNLRFQIRNQEEDEVELLVFDVIGMDLFGDGVTAEDVINFLNDNQDKDIHVRINSPGGLAFEGITIFNALLDHPRRVRTTIEGRAASAAALIAVAGDPVRIQENANFFVHRALGMVIGNEEVMEEARNFLRKVDDGLVSTFAARTGQSQDKIRELLEGNIDGTHLSAKEAKDLGFADELLKVKKKSKTRNQSPDDPDSHTGKKVAPVQNSKEVAQHILNNKEPQPNPNDKEDSISELQKTINQVTAYAKLRLIQAELNSRYRKIEAGFKDIH